VHQEDENVPRALKAHPAEVDLLALALGRAADAPHGTRDHVDGCATCARRAGELTKLADAVRLDDDVSADLDAGDSRPPSEASAFGRSRIARLVGAADAALADVDAFLDGARDGNADLGARVRALAASPTGRLTLLYASQRGAFAAALPQRALALAEAVDAAADVSAEPTGPAGSSCPVPPGLLRAEARLLASQALLNIGRLDEARAAAVSARELFATGGRDPFSTALCDYFEASVRCFQGDFGPAQRLLRSAARVFAEHAQDHWLGRAEGQIAISFLQQGNQKRALAAYDAALERFDPEKDANACAVAFLNRGRCHAALGRFDVARQDFAQALQVARRHRLDGLVLAVRQNLAELELLRGDFEKALVSWRAVAEEADRLGLEEDQIVSRLGAAECLGRLGRDGEMIAALRAIGRLVEVTDLRGNPAWSELAARLDPGDVGVGLVSEVRRHLESALSGFVLPFPAEKRA
jgi:tetratricopeptide (TPR) repeat protein